ncbi:hypothetical protein MELE44368_02010 [Mycolicibacterium elephantis DSM 44368]|uniref:DUF998 domain-containing protein n=1 Tax=Mycolicibacterium elephantis DSM 44368 TaxID=1335622 RepID=A0A439E0S9_9MYCO|nr:hypothetical protein MELE44368_02010 [Mycolicibacterium elephantis DSM 44368]
MGAVASPAASPTRPRTLAVGAACWIVAALGYVLLELLTAAALPGYSYTEHYISSLGVPEWSPRAYLINAAFYAQAVLFLTGALLVARSVRGRFSAVLVVLAALTAVGNILVGTVYGGSALWTNGFEWLHVLGAFLAILGGNAAALAGSAVVARAATARWYLPIGLLIGLAGIAIFAMLQNYNDWAVDYAPVGLVERACVYTILIWQLLSGLLLWTRARR